MATQNSVFDGRQYEPEELKGYLDLALAGRGQVCFGVGQAGKGKMKMRRQYDTRLILFDGIHRVPIDLTAKAILDLAGE